MTEVLRLRGLSRRFGALQAVDNVSLALGTGHIHALIGPNGAGKSTLIALIAGSLAPDAGRVTLAGTDLTGLGEPARVRAGLARTFQVSKVIPEATLLQNVLLAAQARRGLAGFWRRALNDAQGTEAARGHLARVGLTRISRLAAALSHGERRRLEVAMALALEPRAFLLDEPMAGLGADGSAEMTALLASLKADAPILLVEHDMDAVFTLADRVTVLDQGRVVASGTLAEVRADPRAQSAYLGAAP